MADIANVSEAQLVSLYDAITATRSNIRTRILY